MALATVGVAAAAWTLASSPTMSVAPVPPTSVMVVAVLVENVTKVPSCSLMVIEPAVVPEAAV